MFNSFSKTQALKVDNIYGEKTLATVKEFQKKNNLVGDEKTWSKFLK
ncbi:peptidoglycan-binding protein [Gottfriedia sp. NPDC057948]